MRNSNINIITILDIHSNMIINIDIISIIQKKNNEDKGLGTFKAVIGTL